MIRSARKPVLFFAMAGSALAATVLGLLALDAAFPPPLTTTIYNADDTTFNATVGTAFSTANI